MDKIIPVDIRFSGEETQKALHMIQKVLQSGRLSLGMFTEELEQKVAIVTNRRNAIAVSSGTAALEVMFRACIETGLLPEGAEILIPTNTFIATLFGALRAGLHVRFVDTGPDSLSSPAHSFKKQVTANTRAICAVHIGGSAASDIQELVPWAQSQGILFFEDAAQALGVSIHGKPAGSLGIAAAFSLFATKVATSGEGGIIVTDDDTVARKARLLRDYGKADAAHNFHVAEAYNWRMSEVQAAVGIVSVDSLKKRINMRSKLAHRLTSLLHTAREKNKRNLVPVPVPGHVSPNWYKYICLLPPGSDRSVLKQAIAEQGIICAGEVFEVPLHLQPVVCDLGLGKGVFPYAETLCKRHICLPLQEKMSEDNLSYMVEILIKEMNL